MFWSIISVIEFHYSKKQLTIEVSPNGEDQLSNVMLQRDNE